MEPCLTSILSRGHTEGMSLGIAVNPSVLDVTIGSRSLDVDIRGSLDDVVIFIALVSVAKNE